MRADQFISVEQFAGPNRQYCIRGKLHWIQTSKTSFLSSNQLDQNSAQILPVLKQLILEAYPTSARTTNACAQSNRLPRVRS